MNAARQFGAILMALLLAGAAPFPPIDQSLDKAGRYLASRQQPDGSWRSGVHGSFRDGASLTPHVLNVLFFLRDKDGPITAACDKGVNWLLKQKFEELNYPVYTAAETCWLTGWGETTPQKRAAQAMWLDYLRQRQLTRNLGWEEKDPEFGGWGYAPGIPRKPKERQMRGMLVESNLSATVFAVGALRMAGVKKEDPIWKDVLVFVDRCQNFGTGEERFDDGGFFFMPGDAARNKAGVAGVDSSGRERYRSYGSMTADGIRAMLACGRPANHPRIMAARAWLEKNFTTARNPGNYQPDREILRDATYYYWCWSAAHALTRLGVHKGPAGDWARSLSEELMKKQRDDGSWINTVSDGREDDPLVATPFAAAAVAICREQLKQQQDH